MTRDLFLPAITTRTASRPITTGFGPVGLGKCEALAAGFCIADEIHRGGKRENDIEQLAAGSGDVLAIDDHEHVL